MIEIDGSFGEGGGQILRSSISLSVLTEQPVIIKKIRANRPNPGLRAQHLTAVKFLKKISNADVKGLEIGSSTVEFHPGRIVERDYKFDIGTAGSVTLVLQTVVPLAFRIKKPMRIRLRGGTDVRWSPTWDYFRNVFIPLIEKIGINVEASIMRRGFYPKGGGEVEVVIHPAESRNSLTLKEQDYREIRGNIAISKLKDEIARRIEHSVIKKSLQKSLLCKITKERDDNSLSEGVSLTLWSSSGESVIGASKVGERGLPSEKLGGETTDEIIKDILSRASLDVHMTDQILIYISYISTEDGKKSHFLTREISGHAETNAWLIKKFLPVEILMEKQKNGLYGVSVTGT